MTKEPRWLTSDRVLVLHQEQLREHGGSDGIRDPNLLESALARPIQRWTYEPDADLSDLGAAYGFGLSRNHPFIDGNKRTAFVTMAVFLYVNGVLLDAPEPEAVITMLAVAAGEMPESDFAAWIRSHSVPI